MNQTKWVEEMLGFISSTFETTVSTLSAFQDQGEKILHTLIEQGVVAQQDGRKVITEWTSMAKKGREDYRKMMFESINKVSDFFKTAAAQVPKAK